ncbi:MAG: hypothetical protein K6G27_07080 [Lachnospiraceae bacterium]|jgi:hypothetical protein|nr:hypothetical protein [Lachnospiraceae bacterium]
MSEITREEYMNRFKEAAKEYRAKADNIEMNDDAMASATGGVGGANEATCPYCGKAMVPGNYPGVGKGWKCAACGLATDASDAETIQIIRYMEKMGIPDIGYPIWWNKIK